MSNEMEETYRYDQKFKTLIITRKHELNHPTQKEQVVGSRELKDYFDEEGIKAMIKELHAQKNSYERQRKVVTEQLEKKQSDIKNKKLEIDMELYKKMIPILDMWKELGEIKKQEDQLVNNEKALKELNKQINDVKGVVKNYIKL